MNPKIARFITHIPLIPEHLIEKVEVANEDEWITPIILSEVYSNIGYLNYQNRNIYIFEQDGKPTRLVECVIKESN